MDEQAGCQKGSLLGAGSGSAAQRGGRLSSHYTGAGWRPGLSALSWPWLGARSQNCSILDFGACRKGFFSLDCLLSDGTARLSADHVILSAGFSGQCCGICLAPAFLLPFLCWPSEDRCTCSDPVWSTSLKNAGTGFAVISWCFMVTAGKEIFIWKLPPLLI